MKLTISLLAAAFALSAYAQSTLRVNQVGYLCDDFKAAVYVGPIDADKLTFDLISPEAGPGVVDSISRAETWEPFVGAARIYFSSTTIPGRYSLAARDAQTGAVVDVTTLYIGDDAYSRLNINELPLNYLRQQRCGDNPAHNTLCHQHDGILVLSGATDGTHIDVRGGWHDASDYLQYLPTSANTVYQLLYGYSATPDAWADNYDSRGRTGANGIADILDEARWGLEWMLRMNPSDSLYLNQIADDRDHRFIGTPQCDSVDYGWGKGGARPIYPVCGKPYGLKDNKNRSTGEASSVAKFASAFALGSKIFAAYDSAFACDLSRRAEIAYDYARQHPGAAQTAPCVSPYFYEEDNWHDDMELAASSLYDLTRRTIYHTESASHAMSEPVTPWMGADSAKHYQWYPFVNLGHANIAATANKYSNMAQDYMRQGIMAVCARGNSNVFRNGVPFIWCSNNLAVAFVTQAMLYREISGDNSFIEYECAVRDWLFGVNPWGQTMIIMPTESVASSPEDPHSALTDITVSRRPGRDWLIGGLVDGPVYSSIFNSLRGVHLRRKDKFEGCQSSTAVYHDDFCDYSTNEPTMDGTASLAYMLGKLCKPSRQ